MTEQARRTKRRYAYELYPHREDSESRSLAVDVPYQIANAIGMSSGTREWHELIDQGGDAAQAAVNRTVQFLEACHVALLAVALHEGLSGQQAWDEATRWAGDEAGEMLWDAAQQYGVPLNDIKPYPIRGEASTHEHWSQETASGWREAIDLRVSGPESECDECTEPDPTSPDSGEGDRG